jgi:hypothetical protein
LPHIQTHALESKCRQVVVLCVACNRGVKLDL